MRRGYREVVGVKVCVGVKEMWLYNYIVKQRYVKEKIYVRICRSVYLHIIIM